MKFILTIEAASREELLSILNTSGSTLAIMPSVVQSMTGAVQEDDDNGPADANAPAFDKNGLPWDARIHSGNKKFNNDGTWRGVRKTNGQPDAAAVAAVEAELRARVMTAQPAMTAMQPAAMPMPGMVVQQPAMQMPAQPMPVQQPMQMQQPAMVQQPAAPALDFQTLMRNIGTGFQTQASGGGMLMSPEYLAQLCAMLQISNISDIANDPNKIAMAYNQMVADGRWLNV